MSNVLQEDHRPDNQSFSQRALKKDMMLDESLERAEPTGPLLRATGKNGRFTGARLSHSTINGTTGDTGDSCVSLVFSPPGIDQRREHILEECDRLRNDILPELGLYLEDKLHETVVELCGRKTLQERKKNLPFKLLNVKSAVEAAEEAAKEAPKQISPQEMFRRANGVAKCSK
ncbi:unnamed protein product [Angiostrongylus costaricensis]|uniref:Uncharacterized protein n=1 Tax=Angiostrongylus costaricensis TaxID=334426 RepID=A0A0R3PA47_ANGCS|nr:unnamed protein product [Angiostrongylus costaricensis]